MPNPQTISIDALVDALDLLQRDLLEYLEEWPSSRLTHRLGSVMDLQTALRIEKGIVIRSEQEKKDRAAARSEDDDARRYDTHTKTMAAKLGITPAEFLELQERRRQQPTRSLAEARPTAPVVEDMEDPNDR